LWTFGPILEAKDPVVPFLLFDRKDAASGIGGASGYDALPDGAREPVVFLPLAGRLYPYDAAAVVVFKTVGNCRYVARVTPRGTIAHTP